MTIDGESDASEAGAYLKVCHAQTQLRNELSVGLPETEMSGAENLRHMPRHSIHFLRFKRIETRFAP